MANLSLERPPGKQSSGKPPLKKDRFALKFTWKKVLQAQIATLVQVSLKKLPIEKSLKKSQRKKSLFLEKEINEKNQSTFNLISLKIIWYLL